MAWNGLSIDEDFTVDSNGNIRYVGPAHGVATVANYYRVIDFHRWLQDLADNASAAVASASSNDFLDITDKTPSDRSTDNIITLLNNFNIDQVAAEHLYDGTIIQNGGNEIWDGIVVIASRGMKLDVIQNGNVIANDFWNTQPSGQSFLGLNRDDNNGISHKFMIKVRSGGVDIDGRRLIGLTRVNQYTYSEFKINGTSRGNNVMALTYSSDLNNTTPDTTLASFTSITNASQGYNGIDVDNNGSNEFYYSRWTKAAYSINQFYERMKWITRSATIEDSGTGTGTDLPIGNGTITRQAQSFSVGLNPTFPTKVRVKLKKVLSPTGTAVAKIYSHSGQFGSTGVPLTLIATSDPIDVSKLTTTYDYYKFQFTVPNANAGQMILGSDVTITGTGSSASGTTTITVPSTAQLVPGMVITYTAGNGTGSIAANTTIVSITNATQFVASSTNTFTSGSTSSLSFTTNAVITGAGSQATGSTTVTVPSTAKLYPGMLITYTANNGTGSVPAGVSVVSITNSTQFVASAPLTFTSGSLSVLSFTPNYFVSIEYTGGNASNYIQIDSSATSSHAGNRASFAGSWTASGTTDLWFELYGSTAMYNLPGELFRGITHEIALTGSITGNFLAAETITWSGGSGKLIAGSKLTSGATSSDKFWIQLLTGTVPGTGVTLTGANSSATVSTHGTTTAVEKTISTPYCGVSTGSALIGSFGFGVISGDLAATDKVFDLSGNQVTPPDNRTFAVTGLGANDYVLVGPESNGSLQLNQFTLQTTLNTDNITSVVIAGAPNTIPSDTPSSGYIRVADNNGNYRRLHFSARDRATNTFTITTTDGNEDFAAVNANSGNNVFIAYIDQVAGASSVSYSAVYSAPRNLFVRVRFGGTFGSGFSDAIKTFESPATFPGSSAAVRTADA